MIKIKGELERERIKRLDMSGEIFRQDSLDEKVCITQYEQKEYDSCSWENEEFGEY